MKYNKIKIFRCTSGYSLSGCERKWIISGMPMANNKTMDIMIDKNPHFVEKCANNLVYINRHYK